MPLKASYLILAGAGGIVAFSGLKGYSIGATIRDIISGKNPESQSVQNPIAPASYTAQSLSATNPLLATGSATGLAGLAENMIGTPYKWGGAPSSGFMDCSSLMNDIIGVQAGLPIPGYPAGTYNGSLHGPNTIAWLAWIGTGLNRVSLAQSQPGDLAIWQTHMGMIVGKNLLVSDLNPSLGTLQTTISGAAPPFEILTCARLRQT